SSRRRHTRFKCDWSSDVCSSDLCAEIVQGRGVAAGELRRPFAPVSSMAFAQKIKGYVIFQPPVVPGTELLETLPGLPVGALQKRFSRAPQQGQLGAVHLGVIDVTG